MNDVQPAREPLALQFSKQALAFSESALDPALGAAARTAIVDALGVTLAGVTEPATRAVLGLPGVCDAPGSSVVIGTARRTSGLDAALVNGVASHALDFDDFNNLFGGHPTVPVLPAIVAAAEAAGASGRALMAAYVVGVEVESRIALGVHFEHYEKGWHPTSTLGVFGAAAGVAWLMRLPPERFATALAIAASSASGIKANFGTMTKPYHVGRCARDGLMAALMAADGFTADVTALEAKQGFLDVYNGAGAYRIEAMLGAWFAPPLALDPGVSLKQFPCCGSTHPAIHLALSLREKESLVEDQIESVEVLTHPRRLPHTHNPEPETALDAKFSMQYVVARALVDGRVALRDFEGDAHREARVRRIMALVEAGEHPQMRGDESRTFGAEVTVRLRDGRVVSERVDHLPGRGREYPMTESELFEKFRECAGRVLSAPRIERVWEQLMALDALDDVRTLTGLLLTDRASSAAH